MRPVKFLLLSIFALIVGSFGTLGAATPAAAQQVDRKSVEKQFRRWLADNIWPEARAAGVTRETFEAALSGVSLDWSLPDLSPPGAPKTAAARLFASRIQESRALFQ